MVVGNKSFERQIEFIEAHPEMRFGIELNTRGDDAFSDKVLERFAAALNVVTLSLVRAPELKPEQIFCFTGIEQLQVLDFFPTLDLSHFSNLKRLAAHGRSRFPNLESCRSLEGMSWYFSPNQKCNLAAWSELPRMERLEIFYPPFTDRTHVEPADAAA